MILGMAILRKSALGAEGKGGRGMGNSTKKAKIAHIFQRRALISRIAIYFEYSFIVVIYSTKE